MIKNVYVSTKHSNKKNVDYSILTIEFESGYKFEKLLSNEEKFCLVNSGVKENGK